MSDIIGYLKQSHDDEMRAPILTSTQLTEKLSKSSVYNEHVTGLEKRLETNFDKVTCLCKDLTVLRCPDCPNCTCMHKFLSMSFDSQTTVIILPYCMHDISKCLQHIY